MKGLSIKQQKKKKRREWTSLRLSSRKLKAEVVVKDRA